MLNTKQILTFTKSEFGVPTECFSSLNCRLPEGLEDVSTYPRLFAELLADPTWTRADLKKLAGENILRVMREVEQVSILRFSIFSYQVLYIQYGSMKISI